VLVDFHCHTDASDGTLAAGELLAAMRARGVGICSITDHDTVAAYADPAFAGDAPPRLISGVEINTSFGRDEVHVLGYAFSLDPNAPLQKTMEANRVARRLRIERMVAQLRAAGWPLEIDDVLREAGGAHSLGRPHVAKALVRRRLVSDVGRAFRTVLARGGAGYVASDHIRPHDAIAAIVASGGIAVLAHPGRLRDERIVAELVEAGLAGLEVFYPAHGPAQTAHFRDLAARLGLVMSAGSDFHDVRWNVAGVGMDVAEADLRPFLDLLEQRAAFEPSAAAYRQRAQRP
jgi:predicted metal-dependent phosphoesterase TrpH